MFLYTLLSYHMEAYKYDYTRTIKRDGRTQVGVEEVSLTSIRRKSR